MFPRRATASLPRFAYVAFHSADWRPAGAFGVSLLPLFCTSAACAIRSARPSSGAVIIIIIIATTASSPCHHDLLLLRCILHLARPPLCTSRSLSFYRCLFSALLPFSLALSSLSAATSSSSPSPPPCAVPDVHTLHPKDVAVSSRCYISNDPLSFHLRMGYGSYKTQLF